MFLIGRKVMFYLTMYSKHSYLCLSVMVMWVRTTEIIREETRCCHFMDSSLWLVGWNLLYTSVHKQDSTYHGLYYSSCGALAGTRNSSMSPPGGIDLMTHCTMSGCSTTKLYPTFHVSNVIKNMQNFKSNICMIYSHTFTLRAGNLGPKSLNVQSVCDQSLLLSLW